MRRHLIQIPDFDITYVEGENYVYVQVLLAEDNRLDIALTLAPNDEVAKTLGSMNGNLVVSHRLSSLLSRARMLLGLNKLDVDNKLDND